MAGHKVTWRGVFPAVTTQFRSDFSIDFGAIERMVQALVGEGINGIIACGSVGENASLSASEKRDVVSAIHSAAGARVPVLSGVAEITTEAACAYARDMARLGIDGLMVMPPMIYSAAPREIEAWFRAIASASDLPIMLYNNPPAYRNDIPPSLAKDLAGIDTIVAVKESSGDTRRFVDLYNLLGDRFLLFCGLDDVILETASLGAVGWVSGLSNVFPRECSRLFELAVEGKPHEALALYRWIMPLLHLDARADLVQCIKLCEAVAGRGSELTRPPRLPLSGTDRAQVEALMRKAIENRPQLGA
ncbi:MAG TPA: dihydrodipicolinate synthase family protein [Aliidongia sp.]|nr:dihydrodipicolinate synthase family protein [Aliidongia sp.]